MSVHSVDNQKILEIPIKSFTVFTIHHRYVGKYKTYFRVRGVNDPDDATIDINYQAKCHIFSGEKSQHF